MCEIQVKYPGTLDAKRLEALGAEKVASLMQLDEYYTTRNADEVVRIRSERDRMTFTYKGPKTGESFIQRHKLEFEIDGEIEKGMSSVYSLSATIMKRRELYAFKGAFEGLTLSIDTSVTKTKNGSAVLLGDFTEIKTLNEGSKEKMNKLADLLGLTSTKPVTQSYSEM